MGLSLSFYRHLFIQYQDQYSWHIFPHSFFFFKTRCTGNIEDRRGVGDVPCNELLSMFICSALRAVKLSCISAIVSFFGRVAQGVLKEEGAWEMYVPLIAMSFCRWLLAQY